MNTTNMDNNTHNMADKCYHMFVVNADYWTVLGDKHDGGRNCISCGLSYKDYMGITVNDIHAERLRAEKICANDH